MPSYIYIHSDADTKCKLGVNFEAFEPMKNEARTVCEVCNGEIKRQIGSGGGVIFKGSGWFCKDYPKENRCDPPKNYNGP